MSQITQILIVVFAFVWVVIASNQVAKFFQRIKLPLITGFLLSGILIGPYGLQLVQYDSVPKLDFINYTALSFIAIVAGSELYLKEIRNSFKSILWNTFSQLIITFTVISVSVYFLEFIPFLSQMNKTSKIAVAILSGSIFVAKSPSSVVAVINEMRAKGRFTKMAISVTVLLDVLVIILFTVCLTLANNLIHDTSINIIFLLAILLEFIITFLLGYILSKFLKLLLSIKISNFLRAVFLLVVGFSVYKLSGFIEQISLEYFGLEFIIEPLLVCIIASFLVTNYSKYRDELTLVIKESGPAVYAAFFTLAGATLSIDILLDIWLIAFIIFGIYMMALVLSSVIGNTLARNPKLYGRVGWMPFITQAGVGFALIYEISHSFPSWGTEFSTIIIAVIVLNQIIGPPLFKWAIKMAGESHLPKNLSDTNNRSALIFGLEHQSINLARDLQKENYIVEIASVEKRKNIPYIKGLRIHFLESLNVNCLHNIEVNAFSTIILMLSDGENYKVCRLLFNYFENKIVVVRLFDSIFADKFHELGALVVDPATAISKLIEQFVRSPITASLILGEEDKKALVDIKVSDRNLHGIALRNLRLPPDVLILSVKRKGQMLISHGYTRLRRGDIVTVVGSVNSLEDLSLQFEE